MNIDSLKEAASHRAVDDWLKDDMIVGIGTGSTVKKAIEYISLKLKNEEIKGVKFIPTSIETHFMCIEANLPILGEWEEVLKTNLIDLCLDGADKVTQDGFIIKGLGGATLREKIVAYNSFKFVVMVDESKLIENITGFLPLEVIPFSYRFVERKLLELGGEPHRRKSPSGKDGVLLSDNGNFIVDMYFPFDLKDPEEWERKINQIPGIVENGIFTHTNQTVYISYSNGEVKKIDFQSVKNF